MSLHTLSERLHLPPRHHAQSFQVIRILARGVATTLLMVVLVFTVAHIIMALLGIEEFQPSGEPTRNPTRSDLPGFLAIGFMTIGLAVGWWREGIGAGMIAAGLMVFTIVVQPVPTVLVVFGSTGLLFVLSWYGSRKDRLSTSTRRQI